MCLLHYALYIGVNFILHWAWVSWSLLLLVSDWILRENRMVERCVREDSSSCDPNRIIWDRRSRVMRLGSQREESALMHLSTIWFSFYAMVLLNLCISIKYWWKEDFNFCILRVTMWTTLCPNQWVWILPVGLDFASGSGLPVGLDMKTPWARLPAVSCNLHTTMA